MARLFHLRNQAKSYYDSENVRFMQAVPIVQAPDNGQSLNRCTYVFNNPLRYNDPSGYRTQNPFV